MAARLLPARSLSANTAVTIISKYFGCSAGLAGFDDFFFSADLTAEGAVASDMARFAVQSGKGSRAFIAGKRWRREGVCDGCAGFAWGLAPPGWRCPAAQTIGGSTQALHRVVSPLWAGLISSERCVVQVSGLSTSLLLIARLEPVHLIAIQAELCKVLDRLASLPCGLMQPFE